MTREDIQPYYMLRSLITYIYPLALFQTKICAVVIAVAHYTQLDKPRLVTGFPFELQV